MNNKYQLGIESLKNKKLLEERFQIVLSFKLKEVSIVQIKEMSFPSLNLIWNQIKFSYIDYLTITLIYSIEKNSILVKSELNQIIERFNKKSSKKEKKLINKEFFNSIELIKKIFTPKLKELKSKLAWAEIITFYYPDEFIPKTLEQSLYYLQDEFIINWLSELKRKNNNKLIKRFVSAIKIDQRTIVHRQNFGSFLLI